MIEEQQPNKYYPFLDGFRGVAIIGVLLAHIQASFRTDVIYMETCPLLFRICFLGGMGVDMFFVISGFLITGLLLDDLKENQINLKRFYFRRFFKIIPQYYLVITAGLLCAYLTKPEELTPLRGLGYFLFLQNFGEQIQIIGHTWSLAIEEHFYLFYPILLYIICLLKKDSQDRLPLLIMVCLSLIILLSYRRYLLLQGPLEVPFVTTLQRTLFRADALLFGCLLKFLEPFYSDPKQRSFWKKTALGFFFLGVMLYVRFLCVGIFPKEWWHTNLSYLAPACLIFGAYHGWHLGMKNRWLRWVGRNSYGIYLWHYVILFLFVLIFPKDASTDEKILFVLSYTCMAIALGALSTLTIERYFLQLRKKLVP